MKKKFISLVLTAIMSATMLVGCGSSGDTANKSGLKVGMITNSGTLDDKSFNEGSWNGILKAKELHGITEKYLKPKGTTHDDYLEQIKNLYDSGFKFIVTPGFKLETAVFEAQDKYTDAKFVLLDGTPNNGLAGDENISKIGENTVAISFAEEQAGFVAGVATAVELKDGEVGFIGGLEIPSVQKFNWGYQQGIAYAAENLGTTVKIQETNVVYQGSFDDSAAGQQIAGQMYDRGVKAIFVAAGGVGSGVITEAKNRVMNGKEAWVIGADVDQYEEGLYGDNTKSVILTSAIKKLENVVVDMVNDELNDNFKGGENLKFTILNEGVGIPSENPNLSEDTSKVVNEVIEKVKSGEIKISTEKGNLIK